MDVEQIKRELDAFAERLARIDAERKQIVERRNPLLRYAITHKVLTRPAAEFWSRLARQRLYQIVPTEMESRPEDFPDPSV